MNGAITYLRTAAEIKSFVAEGFKKVIDGLRLRNIRVRLQPLLRQLLKDRRNDAQHLEQVAMRLLSWQEARKQRGLDSATLVYHHSGARVLHGFTYRKVAYLKRPNRTEYKVARSRFDRVKAVWLKALATEHEEELALAGIPRDDIDDMRRFGTLPDGYQVHHRVPLDDGGTNDSSNLILIRDDVEHRAVHGYYNPGELRVNLLSPGDRADVVLPLPPEDTVVYPNPHRGYVCEHVPHAALVELFDVN